jgi:hypothetical protein
METEDEGLEAQLSFIRPFLLEPGFGRDDLHAADFLDALLQECP